MTNQPIQKTKDGENTKVSAGEQPVATLEAPKAEQPRPAEPKEKKPAAAKLDKKLEDLISEIEKLNLLELSTLVKALEEKFGITTIPMAAAPAAQGASQASAESPAEGQTTFNVVLASTGANKISVIKAVREINQTLGLKEAKDLVEAAPKEVLIGVNKTTADEAKKKLENAGATVELK